MIVFLKVFLWEMLCFSKDWLSFLGDVMFFKGLVVFLGRCYVFQRIGCVSRGDLCAS